MSWRGLVAIAFLFCGCADRPLWFPGTGPGANGGNGGSGGGGSGGNGGSGNGGSTGGAGGNGGTNAPVPRPVRPLSTGTVTSHRPSFVWDMTGVSGPATLELCADRACATPRGTATVGADGASAQPDQDLPAGPLFWRVTVPAGTSATWELFVKSAGAPVDGAYLNMLDLDGDGVPDSALSASDGSVAVYLGGASGLATPALSIANPDGSKTGFGYAIAAAGDVDGDGFGDLAVGDCGGGAGHVHVYFGAPGGPDPSKAQTLDSPDGKEGFGCRLAGAGDLDADGWADLAVGRVGADFSGGLYVFHGGAGGPVKTTTRIDSPDRATSRIGYSLAGVGDLDGDGYDDLVASEIDADDQSGQAHVYFGGSDGVSNDRVVSLPSPDPRGQQYGASVALAGDVNLDGWPDFVVGSPTVPTVSLPPKAHLYLGGPGAITASASGVDLVTDGSTGFASEVAGGADLDGDGKDDVVVASRSTLVSFLGGAMIGAGRSVAAAGQGLNPRHVVVAGDLDGDGRADLLVADGAGVELFSGGTNGLDRARVTLVAPPAGLGFAGTVARLQRPPQRRVHLLFGRLTLRPIGHRHRARS
jgi:hypothetical protein